MTDVTKSQKTLPASSPKLSRLLRAIGSFVRQIAVSLCVTFLSGLIGYLRIRKEGVPIYLLAPGVAGMLLLAIFVVFGYRRWFYDPVKHTSLAARDSRGLWRLRVMTIVLVLVYFGFMGSSLLVFLEWYSNRGPESSRRRAQAVLQHCVYDPMSRESGKAREFLEEAVTRVNHMAPVREGLVSGTHYLEYLGLDILWVNTVSARRYTYRGRCLNLNGALGSMEKRLDILHWADAPIWELQKHVHINDVETGAPLPFDVEGKPIPRGKDKASKGAYYIISVGCNEESFHFVEEIEWPCALWHEPDGVLFDYSRFHGDVDSSTINMYTSHGTLGAALYRLVLDEEKRVSEVALHDFQSGSLGERPVTEDQEPDLYRQGVRWRRSFVVRHAADEFLFVIWPSGAEEGRPREGVEP